MYSENKTTICPSNTFIVNSEWECRFVASQFGHTWVRSGSWSTYPTGCIYMYKNSDFFFNIHPNGKERETAKIICKVQRGIL